MTLRHSLFLLFWLPLTNQAALPTPVSFNREIRPLMSNTCFHCHGPDASHRKAKLRLDLREEALKPGKSGESPIVPGKPEESEIMKRIFSSDEDALMPPPEEHKPFTPEQKEVFRRWVAEGAVYEPHWAYTPLTQPTVPAPQDTAWGKNAIDSFIRMRQETASLTPSPEADRPTLLRRLSLDLTGLPPAPREVTDFVNDSRSDAWERQVDRLLASPHYGERMAVAWLDVVRFSDTVGYHGDQNQRIYPYRDYVIDSFNNNKPFDQFTREQLAGDLLPHPTEEQLIATGFNRLNMVTREGGAQPGEYLAKYGADRTRVVATAWLGSTFGCAECHDHKFDPISTKDFYSLQAFFADVKQWGVYTDYTFSPNPELKNFTNDHPFPPELTVENRWLLDKAAHAETALRLLIAETAAQREVDALRQPAFHTWLSASQAFSRQHPDGWVSSPASAAERPSTTPPKDLTLTFQPGATTLASLRLEILPEDSPKPLSGTVILTASIQRSGQAQPEPIPFRLADSSSKFERYANGYPVPGITSGWKLIEVPAASRPTGIWLLERPLTLAAGDTLTLSLKAWPFQDLQVSWSPYAVPAPATASTWLGQLRDALSSPAGASLAIINEAWLTSTAADSDAFSTYQTLAAQRREYTEGRTPTLITQAMPPLTVRVRPRGNWQDESGEITPPATPHFLPKPAPTSDRLLNRLDLANWITSPANPLTARTVMNRLWKQCFGIGLSAAVDDLGAQGEPPSHPELLDWLAAEFRDSGWNTKHMMRLLVTSSTYRQHSSQQLKYKDLDPSNRLLTAQNPRRLEAEFVRDNALSIAGMLNSEIGGPSIKPYQPGGYYVNLQFPDRDYTASPETSQWRRGLYMHWQRTFLHPMLANFDAPMRDECAAARMISNTPQQALTLLNDPTFTEAARVFAQRLLSPPIGDDNARLERAWWLALARSPSAAELKSLLDYLKTQREAFANTPEAAAKVAPLDLVDSSPNLTATELAAWISTCRVLLNLHETITRY